MVSMEDKSPQALPLDGRPLPGDASSGALVSPADLTDVKPESLSLKRWSLRFYAGKVPMDTLERAFQQRQAKRFRWPVRIVTAIFFLANFALVYFDWSRFVAAHGVVAAATGVKCSASSLSNLITSGQVGGGFGSNSTAIDGVVVDSCGDSRAFGAALIIRLGVMLPLCLAIIAYTYTPWYSRSAQPLALGIWLLGNCLIGYSVVGRNPGYGVLALLILYIFSFTPVNVFISGVVCTALIGTFGVVLGLTRDSWADTITSDASDVGISAEVQMLNILGVLTSFMLIVGFIGHNLEFWLRQSFLDEVRLQAETLRLHNERTLSRALLTAMLPEPIIAQLQAGRHLIADTLPEVTVLFAELQFDTLAHPPHTVVAVLNLVYSAFDALIDLHRMHKIETVGPVYLCAGGCPEQSQEHATSAADMALAMLEMLPLVRQEVERETGVPGASLDLKVGLNSGPCAAGVVGMKNPRYKLVGDTVNTASRMESTCEPGRIQVSQAVVQALERTAPGAYVTSSRGAISVKGKGTMHTFWLHARCGPSPSAAAVVGGAPSLAVTPVRPASAAMSLGPRASVSRLLQLEQHAGGGDSVSSFSGDLDGSGPGRPSDGLSSSLSGSVRPAVPTSPRDSGDSVYTPSRDTSASVDAPYSSHSSEGVAVHPTSSGRSHTTGARDSDSWRPQDGSLGYGTPGQSPVPTSLRESDSPAPLRISPAPGGRPPHTLSHARFSVSGRALTAAALVADQLAHSTPAYASASAASAGIGISSVADEGSSPYAAIELAAAAGHVTMRRKGARRRGLPPLDAVTIPVALAGSFEADTGRLPPMHPPYTSAPAPQPSSSASPEVFDAPPLSGTTLPPAAPLPPPRLPALSSFRLGGSTLSNSRIPSMRFQPALGPLDERRPDTAASKHTAATGSSNRLSFGRAAAAAVNVLSAAVSSRPLSSAVSWRPKPEAPGDDAGASAHTIVGNAAAGGAGAARDRADTLGAFLVVDDDLFVDDDDGSEDEDEAALAGFFDAVNAERDQVARIGVAANPRQSMLPARRSLGGGPTASASFFVSGGGGAAPGSQSDRTQTAPTAVGPGSALGAASPWAGPGAQGGTITVFSTGGEGAGEDAAGPDGGDGGEPFTRTIADVLTEVMHETAVALGATASGVKARRPSAHPTVIVDLSSPGPAATPTSKRAGTAPGPRSQLLPGGTGVMTLDRTFSQSRLASQLSPRSPSLQQRVASLRMRSPLGLASPGGLYASTMTSPHSSAPGRAVTTDDALYYRGPRLGTLEERSSLGSEASAPLPPSSRATGRRSSARISPAPPDEAHRGGSSAVATGRAATASNAVGAADEHVVHIVGDEERMTISRFSEDSLGVASAVAMSSPTSGASKDAGTCQEADGHESLAIVSVLPPTPTPLPYRPAITPLPGTPGHYRPATAGSAARVMHAESPRKGSSAAAAAAQHVAREAELDVAMARRRDLLALCLNVSSQRGPAAKWERLFQATMRESWRAFLRASVVLGIVAIVLFAAQDYAKYRPTSARSDAANDAEFAVWRMISFVRYAIILPTLVALLGLTYTRRYARSWGFAQGTTTLAILIVGGGIIATSVLGRDPGYGVLALYLVYCLNFSLLALALRIGVLVALVGAYISSALLLGNTGTVTLAEAGLFLMYLAVFTIGESVPVIMREAAVRQNFFRRRRIEIETRKLNMEEQRTNKLLANLLPPVIVPRLRGAHRQLIADSFDEVTILWTDMKGFTSFSSTKTPMEVVTFLNAMFST